VSLTLLAGLLLAAWRPSWAQDDAYAWAQLGPPGPQVVTAFGVSPDWPRDRFLVVARYDRLLKRGPELLRSGDGGDSWQRLPAPDVEITGSAVGPASEAQRTIFRSVGGSTSGTSVQRSTDLGGTWREVLNVGTTNAKVRLTPEFGWNGVAFVSANNGLYSTRDGGGTWQLALQLPVRYHKLFLSPAFARDGVAFVVAGGKLYRSRDGASTWEPTDPGGGQLVSDLALSPDFVRDRTAYVVAASGDFGNTPSGQSDNELSLGVLVSSDGGDTWSALASQPSIDGVPYRQASQLAISPSYAEDGTLFAFARGPWRANNDQPSRPLPSTALFRSVDRGASWSAVLMGSERSISYEMTIGFSPSFAADGRALLAHDSRPAVVLSPAPYSCGEYLTTDGGTSWVVLRPSDPRSVCGAPRLLVHGNRLVGLLFRSTADGPFWRASLDGGQTWSWPLSPPDDYNGRGVVVSPNFGEDGTFLVGGSVGGIWAFGPGLQSTAGSLHCTVETTGGFRRAWESDSWSRSRLGCPIEAERPVQVRERRYNQGSQQIRAYWTEDDESSWFELTIWPDKQSVGLRSKTDWPWPSPPDALLAGVIQRFEGGAMLWLPGQDDTSTVLVLSLADTSWRELVE
jgi:hypothetical protein